MQKILLSALLQKNRWGIHNYRVYLDYRFGSLNRQILMCDEKWIYERENNIGELMAFAEYLNTNEKFGAFEKMACQRLRLRMAFVKNVTDDISAEKRDISSELRRFMKDKNILTERRRTHFSPL